MDFIPSAGVLTAFTLAAITLAITPGPDMTLFLSKTIGQSTRAGLASMLGAACGMLVHSVLVAIGLAAVLAASATAFTVLKVIGALYLAYLAYDALRHGARLNLDGAVATADPLWSVYLKGVAINLLNPKVIAFFVTFLPQFVSQSDPHASAKLLFLGVWLTVIGIVVCTVLIGFAGRFARLLRRSRRAARMVDYALATVLGAFAVKLLATRAS